MAVNGDTFNANKLYVMSFYVMLCLHYIHAEFKKYSNIQYTCLYNV